MKVGAVLNAVGEPELIGPCIAHLRLIQVDRIIVGYGEEDHALAAALTSYEGDADVILHNLGRIADQQDIDMLSRLLRRLLLASPLDRVIFLDPDEFWLPRSGNIKDTALLGGADVLQVRRYNVPLVTDGTSLPDRLSPENYDRIPLIVDTVEGRGEATEDRPEIPWIRLLQAPKIVVNPAVVATIATGGHGPANRALRAAAKVPDDLVIAHLPFTTFERFSRKLGNIDTTLRITGQHFLRNDAWHWRRWNEIWLRGEAEAEFRRQQVTPDEFRAALDAGGVRTARALLDGLAERGRERAAAAARREARLREDARLLINADRRIEAGKAEEAAALLDEVGPDSVLAGGLRLALDGLRHAAAGAEEEASRAFTAVMRYPHFMPGALLAAGRFFLRRGEMEPALVCLARRAAAGHDSWGELAKAGPEATVAPEMLKLHFDRTGRRNLRLLHLMKKRIVAQLEAADAAAAYAALIADRTPAGARRLLLAGLRDVASREAIRFHELQPAGTWTCRLPHVIDGGPRRSVTVPGRGVFVAQMADCVVRGRSTLVQAGRRLLYDHQGNELALIRVDLTAEPEVVEADAAAATLVVLQRRQTEVPEAISLVGHSSHEFGHWMFEYLPKLVMAEAAGMGPEAVILVDAGMPPQHREALDLLNLAGRPVREVELFHSVAAARLWMAATPMFSPIMPVRLDADTPWERLASDTGLFVRLMTERAARVAPAAAAGSPGRIYLARRPNRHRKMVNQDEVEAAAVAAGFAIIHPEDLSFREQFALVRGANWIAGPDGSALCLGLFARPGTRMCVLTHPYTRGQELLTGPLESAGLEVSVLTGTVVKEHPQFQHFADYAIDPDRFARAVADRMVAA